jgi:16S rRNA processing protein RimM
MSSSRSTPTTDRFLAVARVIGAKGLRGGLRLELVTDWPERLAVGATVRIDGGGTDEVTEIEQGGRTPILYLAGVTTREAAEALSGRYLQMREQPLPEGSFYWDDLIGLRVETEDGTAVGELVEIFRAGGNEVFRVIGPAGERLVPALRSAVVDIDLPRRRMVVAPDDAEEVR